ncbi:MAG: HEAT repeat domain-containing protein [Phycisphaerae bacterium]
MPARPKIYRLLAASENPAADEALLEAVGMVEPAMASAVVATLLERGRLAGTSGLIAQLHLLDDSLQQQLVEQVERLFPALRETIRCEPVQTRINSVELIRRSGNCRQAYLLSLALRDRASTVRQAAGRALHWLVQQAMARRSAVLEDLLRGQPDQNRALATISHEHNLLTAAVLEAAKAFDVHRRREVAEAAGWLAETMPQGFWSLIRRQRSRLAHVLLEILQASDDPRLVPLTYCSLAVRQLQQPVARYIAAQGSQQFMTELVRQAWLLGDSRIRRGFARIRSLAWLDETADPLLALPQDLHPRAVDLILACGMPVAVKIELMRELVLRGPRPGQRAALWALIELDHPRSTQLLRTVLSWDEAELSPAALHELRRRNPDELPVPRVRQLADEAGSMSQTAARQCCELSFEGYWSKFEQLDEPTRLAAGQVLLERVANLPELLRAKMASERAADRLRALRIGVLLELCGQLQGSVFRLAGDPDRIVRSCAMTALGQIGGASAEAILRRALQDADKRVQANAIESLERLGVGQQVARLRQKLPDSDNRVRANAVKALLKLRLAEAAGTLLEMLHHPDRTQRVSAIWVIEKLKLMSLARQVAEMADKDSDRHVRRRAALVANALHQAVQQRSDRPAATVKETKP